MKELSIYEKAKRYDEAIYRAKKMFSEKEVNFLFPELTESEGERIRKSLINGFKDYKGWDEEWFDGITVKEAIAWLEKQGEIVAYYEDRLDRCACDNFNKGYKKALEKQGEQKPADKVESSAFKDKLLELFQKFRYIKEGVPTNGDIIDYVDAHIQELIDTVQNKPWSEEDEIMLECIINYFVRALDRAQGDSPLWDDFNEKIDWLKSLRPQNNATDEELAQAKKDAYNDALDKIEYHSGEPTFDDGWSAAIWYLKKKNAQPQNTWKPSDEQITWLYRAADDASQDSRMKQILNELLSDLKKLRGK